MAPILLIETRADSNEEECELEDLAGKVSLLWGEHKPLLTGIVDSLSVCLVVMSSLGCHPYGQRFVSLVCSCMYT